MIRVLLNWLISAVLLWLMSFVPFMNIGFAGWLSIVIAAVVLGLINALLVPVFKGLFKKKNTIVFLIVSLLINAAALWLGGLLVPGFFIEFFPTAIIAAAVLSLVGAGFSR